MSIDEKLIKEQAPFGATHYAEDVDGVVYIHLEPWGFCYMRGSIIPDYELYHLEIKPL